MQHARQTFRRSIWLPLALIFALALPPLWYSLIAAPALRFEVGEWPDQAYLDGAHEPEKNADGTFRWTRDRADLTVPNPSARYGVLRVRAHGWRPPGIVFPIVRVEVGGQAAGSFQPTRDLRSYDILLPRDEIGPNRHITFVSDVYASPSDRREVGFAIDWIELRDAGLPSGPSLTQLGGQALLLALLLALVGALAAPRAFQPIAKTPRHEEGAPGPLEGGLATENDKLPSPVLRQPSHTGPRFFHRHNIAGPRLWAAAAGVGLAAALIGANRADPLWVSGALIGWLAVVGGLLAATWLAAPRFERWLAPWMTPTQARAAWALLVAAAALRLLGATQPIFEIHDIGFHTKWLDAVIKGKLYIYSAPSEFQNRAIFNPPAGYLLMAPLQLVAGSLRLSIQVGTALVDALGCLLLLPLARALGMPARSALLALALYAAMPINTTMLWWGFATNDMAQTAGLVLILALLRLARRPGRARWAAFIAAACACLLMHIGALVLSLALLGAAGLLGWRGIAPAARRAAIGGVAVALGLAGPIYFAAVADPALARPSDEAVVTQPDASAEIGLDLPARLRLAGRAVAIGFVPVGAALAPLGFLLLVRGRKRGGPLVRPLLLGWLAVCLAFFAVYLGLGLLVRYVYFAAPPICLALGALLDALWARRGRVAVTTIVLLVAWSGAALWVLGVLLHIKPSLVPLTH